MNKFKNAAIKILKKAKDPLGALEITRLAIESGLLETEGATPWKTMAAYISVDIKNKGEGSDFKRTERGLFVLNRERKEINETSKEIIEEKKIEEKTVLENGFVGKGGEHLVCSELLFRGFNASIMSVDVGIDIAAVKDNKFFGIQVKTSRKNNLNVYNFHIRRASFERFNFKHVFYIFLLKEKNTVNFLILPSAAVEKEIKSGGIFKVNNEAGYALSIKIRDGNIFLGNKDHEISCYLDKWNLIK